MRGFVDDDDTHLLTDDNDGDDDDQITGSFEGEEDVVERAFPVSADHEVPTRRLKPRRRKQAREMGLERYSEPSAPKAGPRSASTTSRCAVIGVSDLQSFQVWKSFLLGYDDENRQTSAPAWDVLTTTVLCMTKKGASRDVALLVARYVEYNYLPDAPVEAYVNFKECYDYTQFCLTWLPCAAAGSQADRSWNAALYVLDAGCLQECVELVKCRISSSKFFLGAANGQLPVYGLYLSDVGEARVTMESRLAHDPRACEGRPFNTLERCNVVAPFCGSPSAFSDMAANEHASIFSFAAFSMNLLACGAPLELVKGAHRAALDEVRHTQIAVRLAGSGVAPRRMHESFTVEVSPSLERLALTTVRDACINETVALLQMQVRRRASESPRVRAALLQIAADETRHAALAFQTVRWVLKEQPSLGHSLRALFRMHSSRAVLQPLVDWLFSPRDLGDQHLVSLLQNLQSVPMAPLDPQ